MSKIATIITDLVEDIEVTSPKEALENAGHEVVIISNEGVDTVTGKKEPLLQLTRLLIQSIFPILMLC
ncbi:ThiJ/PfpI family protein [Enterococcus sp. HSIEG1]|nr:ThiJ/PfpI family protein [Enterococcus sp. HSIEG1]